jgi:hypothetical protein
MRNDIKHVGYCIIWPIFSATAWGNPNVSRTRCVPKGFNRNRYD